ncbi:MAG: TonB-dependent receptor [Steroidobacteraceae bacterium]
MSTEIRKVVRQIIAPMAAFVPCAALMAAAPAVAAPQNATGSNSSTQSSAEPSNAIASPAPGQLHRVLIVGAEKAVATVNARKFQHVSPGASVTAVLNNVPGFNSRALSVGGFIVSNTAFTLDGFPSSELGTTFDGVPDINTFLGGLFGNGDQPIGQPLVAMDVAGARVYSGASTQADSSIDDLGGTIAFEPAMPAKDFGVRLGTTFGVYQGGGTEMVDHVSVNSGAIQSLNGLNMVAKYERTRVNGPWQNVDEHMNSFYFAAVQPTSSGHVKLVALVNAANGNTPSYVASPIIAQYGYDYNFPMNVSFQNQETQSTFVSLSAKSLLNPRMIGEIKAFYVGTNNDRTAWGNPIYANGYEGYSDLNVTFKGCSDLNAFLSAPPYPEAYNCAVATQQFGSPAAGTAYQRYIQNYAEMGAMGHLTFLLPDNTVQVGASGFVAPMLSTESWYGSWPVPANKTGFNAAWLEHDGQTWMQAYAQDNIRLLNGKLHIYPGVKFTRLDMFSNDDQGYFYQNSGSVTKIYRYIEDSIGINYSFTRELNAYVNWGQSTKPPDISALYGVIGAQQPGPVVVKPEKVNNIDAGIRFKSRAYYWDVAFFNRDFTNIFSSTYSSLSGITLTTNAGNATSRGFTLGAGVNLPYHFELEGNAGYTHFVYTTDFTNVSGSAFTNGMWRPNIPVETGNLELVYARGPWYGSVDEHYTGSEYLTNYFTGVTTNQQLGGYGTLNLTGSYTFDVHTSTLKSLKLEVHVDNALNRRSPFYSPGFEPTDPALGNPGAPFTWLIYNTPLFASLNVTADLF